MKINCRFRYSNSKPCKLVLAIMFVLGFLGCTTDKHKHTTKVLNEILLKLGVSNHIQGKKVFLFIPFEKGCDSCRETVFTTYQYSTHPHIFVVCSASTKKSINAWLYRYNITNGKGKENIIMDVGQKTSRKGLVDSYPVAYFVEGGEVVNFMKINLSNVKADFDKMKEFLM